MEKRVVYVPPSRENLEDICPAQEFDPRLIRACNRLLDWLLDEGEDEPDEVAENPEGE